jgi:hypothetical protein
VIDAVFTVSEINDPLLAVTTVTDVSVCHRRRPMIIGHVTARNFSLDGCLFFEVRGDVISVGLPLFPVPPRA